MGLFNIMDISAAAMGVQRTRLEVAATNLANAQTSSASPGATYQPLAAIVRSVVPSQADPSRMASGAAEDNLPVPVVAELVPMNVAPRRMYEPGHPDADAQGFVNYPGIDPVSTMLDLISISRSYEANLKAFDITRSLLQRSLDIGSQR
ncbi:MAG TPA: flagellar basal body rod protein FlgC [Steroidobacteraceae bacterium]|jgi:flagellar basal-body rod protein FlgC|nr:flagellar basal body rod protein FlgC [Steroidobacteraceae bacterium]